MRFSNDKLSPIYIYFYACNRSVCKNCLSKDVNPGIRQKCKKESYWEKWIVRDRFVFCFYFSSVLAQKLFCSPSLRKIPLIAKQFVCAGGLHEPGKKKKKIFCMWSDTPVRLSKRDEWQNPTEHKKTPTHTRKGKSTTASDFDSGNVQ